MIAVDARLTPSVLSIAARLPPMLFLSVLAVVAALSDKAQQTTCVFHRTADRWQGSCGRLFDQTPAMSIAPAKAITTGTWRADMQPSAVWAGEMSDEDYGKAPIEIEIYHGGWGVFRTVYGWLPVTRFHAGSRSLEFKIDPAAEVPPSELDREIVRRAAAMLSSDSVWNRADNRKCPKDAASRSIYCAMVDATIAVTGAFHHRRPAMEIVRKIIDERSAGRPYDHRLMDYNNDPTTHLQDVQSLFDEALKRMRH